MDANSTTGLPSQAGSALPAGLDLGPTLGAAFLGNIFTAILYGITCLQTFTYFRSSQNDGCFLRSVIGLLWLLDTLHIVLVTFGMYHYLILNFMNLAAIQSPDWSFLVQVYITCISDVIVRSVFCSRVWVLSHRNKILCTLIMITSIFTCVTGSTFVSRGFGQTFAWLYLRSWELYASLGSAVASDLMIALSLCYFLMMNKTGYKGTDNLVTTLMTYTINTSLLTSVCAITCFVTFAIWPHDFIFISVYFTLSKLYLNSLLASLNARESLFQRALDLTNDDSGKGPRSTHLAFSVGDSRIYRSGSRSSNNVGDKVENEADTIELAPSEMNESERTRVVSTGDRPSTTTSIKDDHDATFHQRRHSKPVLGHHSLP